MQLYLFSHVTSNPVVQHLIAFKTAPTTDLYFEIFPKLLEYSQAGSTEMPVREYLLGHCLNVNSKGDQLTQPSLSDYLLEDGNTLYQFAFETDWDALCQSIGVLPFAGAPQRKHTSAYSKEMHQLCAARSGEELAECMLSFFKRYSDPEEAKYLGFRWENHQLIGIEAMDSITFDSLGGLEAQKAKLIQNTQAFLEGKPANNVLLVGSSGTGKSSSVKATLNHFADQGLNMVELSKNDLPQLPDLMEILRHKKQHYIIFIDDLSFEGTDSAYIALKVALDGQLEPKPAHVLIYATSNRRRLMKESWADREGADDIHSHDTLHEKMSLSERFGIRLYFGVLSQREYFQIVELMLEPHGIEFTEQLGVEAATWAMTNNGRSGRTARQFVNHYIAKTL